MAKEKNLKLSYSHRPTAAFYSTRISDDLGDTSNTVDHLLISNSSASFWLIFLSLGLPLSQSYFCRYNAVYGSIETAVLLAG